MRSHRRSSRSRKSPISGSSIPEACSARGGNGAGGGGLGLGDGLASQLLSVSAFKPMIDKILTEAGFHAGLDALTSLTQALAAKQLAASIESPAASEGISTRDGARL
jgi:hypothetical protein